jgi:hypothetical protein
LVDTWLHPAILFADLDKLFHLLGTVIGDSEALELSGLVSIVHCATDFLVRSCWVRSVQIEYVDLVMSGLSALDTTVELGTVFERLRGGFYTNFQNRKWDKHTLGAFKTSSEPVTLVAIFSFLCVPGCHETTLVSKVIQFPSLTWPNNLSLLPGAPTG